MAYNPFWFFTSHATTFSTQLVKFVCFLFTLFFPLFSIFFILLPAKFYNIFRNWRRLSTRFFSSLSNDSTDLCLVGAERTTIFAKIEILKATAPFFIKIYGKFMNYFANSWSVTLFDQFQEVSIKAVTNCVFSYFHRRCKHTLGPRETANNTCFDNFVFWSYGNSSLQSRFKFWKWIAINRLVDFAQ